ncbi:unnamed protein product [Blepharisma stoltei]|uniref:Uncharacterized protein n=1 Tax=Blepharisma stoltei TaxID=1481888 RepID=A0AAU9J7G5_9CILI|nr:unnamed protein product [Blepharisma stoltei]
MMKTIIQTILIVLNKTVKRASDIGHGIIFIVVMIVYIAFIFKFRPYNYARFSLWQGISLIGVVWLALLSTIGLGFQSSNFLTPLLLILISGWILMVSFGIYVQHKKCPSMLYRAKARDTNTLFKFAFTFGKVSKKRLEQFKKGSKTVSN